MAELQFTDVTKSYGDAVALDNVSFTIPDGSFYALLGSSGSGKTTALRAIAGFVQPDSGSILVDGRNIVPVPAHRRGMGLMFQSYALFPHLSVRENVAYGLRRRKVDDQTIRSAVTDILGLVGMAALGHRKPNQLSGGQQQRVALARALVIKPPILLLDEPLSALDRKIRQELQAVLKEVQQETGVTTLIVTHDQEEALFLGDEMLILEKGRVRQIGIPHQVYEQPRDSFVARFMGESNVWPGQLADDAGTPVATVGDIRFSLDSEALPAGADDVVVSVRPEHVHIAPVSPVEAAQSDQSDQQAQPDRTIRFEAEVLTVQLAGPLARVQLLAQGVTMVSLRLAPDLAGIVRGSRVRVSLRPQDVHVYPSDETGPTKETP